MARFQQLVFQFEKPGNALTQKLLQNYASISQFCDRTQDQISKFPFGEMKGKWVGMTKARLGDVITLPKP